MEYIAVYVTAPNEEEASNLSHTLVGERLAACVNIVGNVRSIYRWEGKVEDSPEVLMIIKTRRPLFQRLKDRVRELHTYSVPEIIALPIVEGHEDYLGWVGEATSGPEIK